MMKSANQYLFDQDFQENASFSGHGNGTQYAKRIEDVATELNARYEEGREHGLAEAQASIEGEALTALCAIRDTMLLVSQSMNKELARIEAESIRMAATLAKLYADALIDKDPTPVIADAVRKCAAMANSTPALTISISPQSPNKVRETISNAILEAGYSGQISIREEKGLKSGDIRVDWPEGGFLRDQTRIDTIIRTMLEVQLDQDSIGKEV